MSLKTKKIVKQLEKMGWIFVKQLSGAVVWVFKKGDITATYEEKNNKVEVEVEDDNQMLDTFDYNIDEIVNKGEIFVARLIHGEVTKVIEKYEKEGV